MTRAVFLQIYKSSAGASQDIFISSTPSLAPENLSVIWHVANQGVRYIRGKAGLTQAAFAARHLIPRRTLEDWERGVRTPAPYLVLLLAEAEGLLPKVSAE